MTIILYLCIEIIKERILIFLMSRGVQSINRSLLLGVDISASTFVLFRLHKKNYNEDCIEKLFCSDCISYVGKPFVSSNFLL